MMMDGDSGIGDDQSSGWCEVKKRHRTNSKLSLQKAPPGPSYRKKLYSPCREPSKDDCSSHVCSGKLDKHSNIVLTPETKISPEKTAMLLEQATDSSERNDNLITDQANKSLKEPEEIFDAKDEVMTNSGVPSKEKLKLPKIKWGDLEDDILPPLEYLRAGRDCSLQSEKASSDESPLQEKEVIVAEDVEQPPSIGIVSSDLQKEVICLESVDLTNSKLEDALASSTTSVVAEATDNSLIEDPECKAGDEGDSIDVINVNDKDDISFPNQKNGGGYYVDASAIATLEDKTDLHGNLTDKTDIEEGDSGESKERFRERLWCFLFENLNRAVDELYLLCELECDVEQMNEAILVLEEAASDFRELKSRVANFDSTKRSPLHASKDGASMNVRNDNRRPHALSWEVRRMTTSPHRAEILSSSLEAFKKIQMERASQNASRSSRDLGSPTTSLKVCSGPLPLPKNNQPARISSLKSEKYMPNSDPNHQKINAKKPNRETLKQSSSGQNGHSLPPGLPPAATKHEPFGSIVMTEKHVGKRDKVFTENKVDKQPKGVDLVKRHTTVVDKEKDKWNATAWKSMDAWKEKRNWEDILKSPAQSNSRVSHSPCLGRKSLERERARVLHDKFMSPEKRKKSALDLKREAEEKHARARRIRSQLENERAQRLQRTSEKLSRVNEWQAVRNLKLREGLYARQQRSETRHEAYLAQVARRAGDESHKVNEVRFITSLNEENRKLMLRQKLHDSELRRAEKLQLIRTKQREDMAREEAVVERRKLLEAEKLQRLSEIQRKKEDAQARREEERKASSAAREARAVEQLRRKEIRAKAQQEEAELLAQKLAEKLRESEQRRKYYLEQIREKASMDFKDQSSPLVRRFVNKDGQVRSTGCNSSEELQTTLSSSTVHSAVGPGSTSQQQSLKRRIKKIRQRLMALKHGLSETLENNEGAGIAHKASMGAARVKLGRWLQDLQKLRLARKEGAISIGLIVGDMIKFLEGKEQELHVARQAGLLDFIASALPATHTSKPEACQVTVFLLRLLKVLLSLSANRSYFLAQNLLPPIIPMLSTSLENYIKIAASCNPGSTSGLPSKTSTENLESIGEVLDGFLWTVMAIVGLVHCDERQNQMQDGLIELTVAYQVIHHLRDLFALYDRPQVEGSPFPSSILLSLNLLAVLTSRPGCMSSIDWKSCASKTSIYLVQGNSLEKDTGGSPGNMPLLNSASEDLNMNGFAPINKCGQVSTDDKLVSLPDDSDKKDSSSSLRELNGVETALELCSTNAAGESQNIMLEEAAKSLSLKGDKAAEGSAKKDKIEEHTIADTSTKESCAKQSVKFLLAAVAETGLVSLPSLLTAVLLQANNRTSSEQASYILPQNFEEAATGVLKVLNNLALLDLPLLQGMLSRSDLKMEFFHLMSFLLSHCTSKWKAANDQVGLLLMECLLLLSYFSLFHPENRAVLRWGKSPTILHKVCDLPFVFFSDPELTPILAGTLVAACYECEQNKGVVQQELSMDMVLFLIKSCKEGLLSAQTESSPPDNSSAIESSCDGLQMILDTRKSPNDLPIRSNRRASGRLSLGKGGGNTSNVRSNRPRTQNNRGSKTCDEWALKHNQPASEVSSAFMLHRRFPIAFLDKAEQFFSAETPNSL